MHLASGRSLAYRAGGPGGRYGKTHTKLLGSKADVIAPDGSEVRLLPGVTRDFSA
jgi:hypothetical protein